MQRDSAATMDLPTLESPMMSQQPKHFVFLACPPGTELSGNSAATLFASVIQPEDMETFLCHWINQNQLTWTGAFNKPYHQRVGPPSFLHCPKVVMLLSRQEIGRLAMWCHRFFSQGDQRVLYTPKVVTEFYGLTRDVESLYYGICQARYMPQHNLCVWVPPALGLPYITGVRWTGPTCKFFRMPIDQPNTLNNALIDLPDPTLESDIALASTPGYKPSIPGQMGNGISPVHDYPLGMYKLKPDSSSGLPGASSSGEGKEKKRE
ncbi:hypothetical protein LX36DRAFT_739126 [Colletotrichum falcatum]|nr:hypothetical protein LX36DRAFT_739126 [Colletotrichum falcatum]